MRIGAIQSSDGDPRRGTQAATKRLSEEIVAFPKERFTFAAPQPAVPIIRTSNSTSRSGRVLLPLVLVLVFVSVCLSSPSAYAQAVTNVRAQQLPDRTVQVLYDLSGAPSGNEVYLDISSNGGATYVPTSFYDFFVTDGTNKRIVWNCSADLPANTYGTNYKARVVLTDGNYPFPEYYGYSNIFTIDLRVGTATLSVSPSSLTFSATAGVNPSVQTLSISNTGSGTLSWSVSGNQSWLSATPTSGSGNASVTVSVSTAGLASGTYAGTITVSASGASGSPKTIPVTLTVTEGPGSPILSVSPSSLSFAASENSTPAAQTLSISNTGIGTLSWSVSDNASWLSETPMSGSGGVPVTVFVSAAGLAVGSYAGAITVSASGASGSPKTIPVTLLITDCSASVET